MNQALGNLLEAGKPFFVKDARDNGGLYARCCHRIVRADGWLGYAAAFIHHKRQASIPMPRITAL